MGDTQIPQIDTLIDQYITRALEEDVRTGDHTSLACIPADARDRAQLLVKDPGVIAGIAVARRIFERVDPTATIDVKIEDGSDINIGDVVFEVECNSPGPTQGRTHCAQYHATHEWHCNTEQPL